MKLVIIVCKQIVHWGKLAPSGPARFLCPPPHVCLPIFRKLLLVKKDLYISIEEFANAKIKLLSFYYE